MYRIILRGSAGKRAWGFIAFAVVLMTVGLSLWADVPGHKPDREVRVESFKPQGTTDPAVNIAIKFSNSLVPPDSLKCPTRIIPVQITPDIDGLARWTATDLLIIYPSRPLKPATEYKATVRAGSGFVNGNAIRRDQDFSFRIPPFSIEVSRYRAQRSREHKRKARLTFDLDFNYPVSRERLRNALRIKGRKNASQFRLSVVWPDSTSDRTKLPAQSSRFRLATELFDLREEDQQYQLTIDRDLRCVDCGNGLTVDYTYTMTVPQNPGIDLIVQEIHGDHSGKQGSIMIRFSSQVPTDEVREHVSIDPAIPFSVEGSWRGVRLRGSFEPRASYTVNVSSGLMSTNGELMERDFSSNVVMGDLTPVV